MKCIKISHQKASIIMKNIAVAYGKEIDEVKKTFNVCSEILLDSGSKLVKMNNVWMIQSYSYDNSDLNFLKKRIQIKK